MITLWNTIIYQPIYNALIFIAQHMTGQDVGLAVIVLTIIIRLILFPLSKKSIVGQYKMRALEPKLQEIKNKGLSKEAEAQATFALYKDEKINPFSGCLYIVIQLPILLALSLCFTHGVNQPTHLYHFLSTQGLKNTFLGIIDITKPYFLFALLAGITQAIQAFLMPKPVPPGHAGDNNMQAKLAQSLSVQTKYILPVLIVVIASRLASAVSIYWAMANIFSIMQELYLRKTVRNKLVNNKSIY